MSDEASIGNDAALYPGESAAANPDSVCPVCGGPLISEKCKVICRSDRCRYRIVFNCAEF